MNNFIKVFFAALIAIPLGAGVCIGLYYIALFLLGGLSQCNETVSTVILCICGVALFAWKVSRDMPQQSDEEKEEFLRQHHLDGDYKEE